MAEKSTRKQEQIENTKRQDAERLRTLATEMEEELLTGNDAATPTPELMYRMVRRQGREIDELQAAVAATDTRSSWLKWWDDRHVFVQRSLLFMPFLVIFEGLDILRMSVHMRYHPADEFQSTGILNGLLPMIMDFLQAAGGGI